MPSLTYDHVAALASISTRRVRQLVDAGECPKPDGVEFDAEEIGQWLQKRYAGDSFQAERTRLTKAQADKTELEVAELSGELVRADEVTTAWGEKIAAARSRLLAWASKVAARVAPSGKTAEVHALAQSTVHEALNELAGDGLPERTRARRASHATDLAPATRSDGKPVGRQRAKTKPRVKR